MIKKYILAKLAEGNMIATEAKYHRNCLLRFYCEIKNTNSIPHLESKNNSFACGIALPENVNFIKSMIKNSTDFCPIFKPSKMKHHLTKHLPKVLTNVQMSTVHD